MTKKSEAVRTPNPNHKAYKAALESALTTFAVGPPGTGKTYMAVNIAYSQLTDRKIGKIILARPPEGTEKSLGFEPGSMEVKLEGWMKPLSDPLIELMGKSAFLNRLGKSIEFVPLHQMMGRSFDNSFIIIDEAQNMSIATAKSLVTRTGKYSKLVICGDIKQQCIRSESGLGFLLNLVDKYDMPVNKITFTLEDCLRSKECKQWLEVFDKEGLL